MATLGDSVYRYLQSLVDISVYVYNESQWGLVDLGLGRSLQPRSPKPWRRISRPWRRQTATFRWLYQSWRKLSFKQKTRFLKFSDGKWHISEKCLKHCQIISKQASQWFIFQLNTMPSHYKLAKVRLTVQKRSLVSWKHSWWRKTARKFEEKQAFFGVLPFFSVSS